MYRKIRASWMKHIDFELCDILCMEIAFFMAYAIRHRNNITAMLPMYMRLALLILLFDIVVVFFSENYKNILQRTVERELFAVVEHVTSVQLLLLLYEYIMKESYLFSRAVFLIYWGLAIAFCFGERLLLKIFIRKRITSEKNQVKMLLITSKDHVNTCVRDICQKKFREFKICGIALPNEKEDVERLDADIPILFGKEALIDYIRLDVVDEVFIDAFEDSDNLDHMIRLFLGMGITVHISMSFLPENLPNRMIGKIGASEVITTTFKLADSWKLDVKRLFDIFGALIGLVVAGIALVILTPIIKIQSPGPVIFKQQRVGKNGRVFYMYKFRSMYMDAEERKKDLMSENQMDGYMFKMENDPRVIGSEKGPGKGIGNFIRKTSIDELPQFYNILKGDMSLVGTRPPTVNEYEKYNLRHKIRLSMSPGLTGLWQVSGRSDITDFNEVVRLDAEYIEKWSLWLDVKILFKTIGVVLKRSGAK